MLDAPSQGGYGDKSASE